MTTRTISTYALSSSFASCLSSRHESKTQPQVQMPKKIATSHSHKQAVTTHASATSSTAPSTPAPVLEAGASTSSGTTGGFLNPPPSTANIPAVPSNFVPESGADYRGTSPRKAELVALPLALTDLANFANYATVIGTTAPPYETLMQMFAVTNAWSSMRTASSAWDAYCQEQEGICWRTMRGGMDRLRPAFTLAASGDPTLTTRFAGLTTLLGVKQAIAKKGVSTRRANKKALAEGKAPVHGQVGKQRKKAADKAIVAAANGTNGGVTVAQPSSAPTAPVAVGPAAPVASVAPVAAVAPVVVAPAASGVPAAAVPATVTVGSTPVVNGVNGVGH
jgi:hypothetical protein